MDGQTEPRTRELVIERVFKAPPALVFKMWTEPEHMARWWGCPDTEKIHVTNEPRVGGALRAEMTLVDGALHVVIGEYLAVDAPRHLSFTWDWENGELGTKTVVTVDLEEVEAQTKMTMTHRLFDTTELRDLHGEGWAASLSRLEALFEGGDAP